MEKWKVKPYMEKDRCQLHTAEHRSSVILYISNAEYDAAKDEQRDIEARIEEIEKILKNAEVVVEDEVDLDRISVGCKVKVHDYEFEEDMELKIVGSTEANSLEGKISNESPVGKALIGAHTNDIVEVEMPSGIMKYKVLEIQRNV